MRLQYPLEIVTPTLDGEVLRVLAGAQDWFAVHTINSLVPERSDEGIRKTLKRLTSVGIVEELSASRTHLYRLNREHLGAGPIIELASLKQLFFQRIHSFFEECEITPMFACIFGSAAREEMTHSSDVDLFVIQPDDAVITVWDSQLTSLSEQASKWIGAELRLLLYTESEVRGLKQSEPVFEYIAQEGIPVFGERHNFLNMMR